VSQRPGDIPVIKSVEEHVYEVLRDRIVRGVYAPHAPLRLAPFADELGVSTMPVRAALLRLEGEGLVRAVPRRGSIVAPLDLNDLEEIQAIRSAIEGFAARLGAERIEPDGIEAMRRALERLRSATSLDEYLQAEWDGYSACYAAAGRARLLRLIADYRRRAERYIRVSLAARPKFGDAVDYQRQLIDACVARDGEHAERVIHASIAWTLPTIAPIIADLQQKGEAARK
jgi:DNA-binding GntR family transcriptional regulator